MDINNKHPKSTGEIMAQYLSFVFAEDIDTADLDVFRRVHGCIGVSNYKNTLNLYFRTISRNTLFNLSLALHQHLARGYDLVLNTVTVDETVSAANIYEALREEVAI